MPYRVLCNGEFQKSLEARTGVILTLSRFTPLHKTRYGVAYSDHDEIVLFLSDEDLITMINLKREGNSPSALIDQKYHEFLGKK